MWNHHAARLGDENHTWLTRKRNETLSGSIDEIIHALISYWERGHEELEIKAYNAQLELDLWKGEISEYLHMPCAHTTCLRSYVESLDFPFPGETLDLRSLAKLMGASLKRLHQRAIARGDFPAGIRYEIPYKCRRCGRPDSIFLG